jgi:hypothetical protein
MGDDWYVPPLQLYSPLAMVLSVMLFSVAANNVGAAGAACVALITSRIKSCT